jgi:hypothetical protein
MLRTPIAETLHSTPELKKVLIKYNTPLLFNAPVERIFSVGGAILSKKKKREKMNDEHFEKTKVQQKFLRMICFKCSVYPLQQLFYYFILKNCYTNYKTSFIYSHFSVKYN